MASGTDGLTAYQQKLRHPLWQKKRLEVLERAAWKCQCCGGNEETLEIHHLIYGRGEPWEIDSKHLECLCSPCHQFREEFNSFFGRYSIPTKFCRATFWFLRRYFEASPQQLDNIGVRLDRFLKILRDEEQDHTWLRPK